MPQPTLYEILHSTEDQDLELNGQEPESDTEEVAEGVCVECRDQQSQLYCEQCQEDFCQVCSDMIHRTGNRRTHSRKRLDHLVPEIEPKIDSRKPEEELAEPAEPAAGFHESTRPVENFSEWIKQRAKYIPLRLTLRERKYLRLLEAALNVSEYTDRVDILMYGNKSKRMVSQIKELCAILSGLVLASDYKVGQMLFETKEFGENQAFYQKIFEIGRRHKIMNPEKMRDQYGKMMFLLQDSQAHEVSQMLGFELVQPIKTVHSVLESLGAAYLLEDEMVEVATREILAGGKTRGQLALEKKQKERAVEYLAKAYATGECPAEVIRQCLYSIGDNHAYLRFTRDACDRMSEYLARYFDPASGGELAILYGKDGARLSHSHGQQYQYVRQTLKLWREIQHEMFMLWHQADQDLLSTRNAYRLKDTGQGLHRVQSCPRVSQTSHAILHRTQKALRGQWVGSAMIHLGDRNVPNALVFIDKYNQVPSILNPVIKVIEYLEALPEQHSGESKLVADTYGGKEEAARRVLGDFFRSAFDGSGADNFFDAGSCIDGRLTSAWNWCSQVEKKPFFNLFLLSGFVGFN